MGVFTESWQSTDIPHNMYRVASEPQNYIASSTLQNPSELLDPSRCYDCEAIQITTPVVATYLYDSSYDLVCRTDYVSVTWPLAAETKRCPPSSLNYDSKPTTHYPSS